MPTRFYLRAADAPLDIDPTTDLDRLLSLTAPSGAGGLGAWTAITGPVSPPSITTQLTQTTTGPRERWLTLPLDAVTIEGTLTLNLIGRESSAGVNATFWVRLYRADTAGVDLATIDSAVRTGATELSTSDSIHNWTRTPTSTAILQGERIGLEVHFDDASGVTMASGVTIVQNEGGGAAWLAYVEFAETITIVSSKVPKDQMHIHGPVAAQQE